MATRNSRRRSKNVIDLESSGDELDCDSASHTIDRLAPSVMHQMGAQVAWR